MSMLGGWITTVCAVLFLAAFVMDAFGLGANPYAGIIFFLLLPAGFVGGLLLIPAGMWLERRRQMHVGATAERIWPRLDLNDARHRRLAFLLATLSVVNVVIIALAVARGIEYMDSVAFCGTLCHAVMEPEYTAYQDGPHSRVRCVQCHIGPGAPWFVKSKLSGLRQVYAVVFDTYSRPVPSPVRDLRPARDTCEQCHWPEKFHGDVVREVRSYASDEATAETVTTVQLHVGTGGTGPLSPTGIHWHVSPMNRIEYVATDERRQQIPVVRLTTSGGTVREYRTVDLAPGREGQGERREMDCVDCHNRPTHPFAASVERALDDALALGAIPRSLPFVRREALALLSADYNSQGEALQAIAASLSRFYREQLGETFSTRSHEVNRAVAAIQQLYRRNVFPTMKVSWGSHPNNIGHTDFPGCFRCHDDNHRSADGHVISQDCNLCHTIR